MEWISDVSVGDWLRERLDDPWQYTMHDAVPRGYPAYARILHPAIRSRPVGEAWPPMPRSHHRRAWDRFERSTPPVENEVVTWADAASAFGTVLNPAAQWRSLVRQRDAEPETDPVDDAGWMYGPPPEGDPPQALLSSLASRLIDHTGTPGDGVVAIWDGFGGLVGFLGDGPARATVSFRGAVTLAAAPAGEDSDPRHRRFLESIRRDLFRSPFRKPTWQPGILSDETSQGPRLSLPDRDYILFRGGAEQFATADWVWQMPWTEPGEVFPAQAPSMIWPEDRAWVVVSEIDWDSTIVAGTPDLIADVVAHPSLEALEIPTDTRLTWDADPING